MKSVEFGKCGPTTWRMSSGTSAKSSAHTIMLQWTQNFLGWWPAPSGSSDPRQTTSISCSSAMWTCSRSFSLDSASSTRTARHHQATPPGSLTSSSTLGNLTFYFTGISPDVSLTGRVFFPWDSTRDTVAQFFEK